MGKHWTADEAAALEAAWRSPSAANVDRDAFCEAYARQSGRTPTAVRLKLQRMGLMRASRGSEAGGAGSSEGAAPVAAMPEEPKAEVELGARASGGEPEGMAEGAGATGGEPEAPAPTPLLDPVGELPLMFQQEPLPAAPGDQRQGDAAPAPGQAVAVDMPGLSVGMVAEGLKGVCGLLSVVTGAGEAGQLSDAQAKAYAEGMHPLLSRWAMTSTSDPAKFMFFSTAAALAVAKGPVYVAAYRERDLVALPAAEGQGETASNEEAEPSAGSSSMPSPPAGMVLPAEEAEDGE